MPLVKTQIYTIDYIYSLPDGQCAELIDAVVYDMALPSFRHQKILSFLHIEIGTLPYLFFILAYFIHQSDKIPYSLS